MAAGNVETGFCLPSEVNKDFIRNLIWQHQQQQQQKNNQQQTTKYQPIHIKRSFKIQTGKDLY